MSPEDVVRTLFARVRAHDVSVSDLFAPDATLEAPGRQIRGRDEIRRFYEGVFQSGGVHPEVEELFVAAPVVAALLRVTGATGDVLRVLDLFELEAGVIRSMRVCMTVTN